MVRGPKPMASALHSVGRKTKHPERTNKNEPKPKRGWPETPSSISKDAMAVKRWHHVCKELDSMGILTTADFYLLEIHCDNYSQWRNLKAIVDELGVVNIGKFGVSAKPEAKIKLELERQMIKQISELGLTPSARTRLKVTENKEESPFEAWLNSDN